jgi:hypothetical protein
MFYVNVYQKRQCYGGPEEGGWWFDAWEPLEELDEEGNYYANPKYIYKTAHTEAEAKKIQEELQKVYPFDRKAYTSVLDRGPQYEVRIENCLPTAGSNYRPYE